MSARMGIIQEVLYLKYGKHPRQALFFTVIKINLSHYLKFNLNDRLFCISARTPSSWIFIAIQRHITSY